MPLDAHQLDLASEVAYSLAEHPHLRAQGNIDEPQSLFVACAALAGRFIAETAPLAKLSGSAAVELEEAAERAAHGARAVQRIAV
ncbi:MAG: hypothetical protein ACLP8S_02420 [Solirubrobacteraceae bacterium]